MKSRRRQMSLFFALALAALLGPVATVATAMPAGPRLTFLAAELLLPEGKSPKAEAKLVSRLVSSDPQGGDIRPLLGSPSIEGIGPQASWSSDGSEFAFVGSLRAFRSQKSRLYLANGDGNGVHVVPGTIGASDPVLSADGTLLAFSRTRERHPKFDFKHPKSFLKTLKHSYLSTTTWIVPTAGGPARRLTRWGNGRVSTPSSFSPDDSQLALTVAHTGAEEQVDTVDLVTGRLRTLVVDGSDAVYSPDGTKIAFASYRDHESVEGFDGPEGTGELYVAAADGTHAVRVTHTPRASERAPSWDPSGSRLAYLRAPGGLLGVLEQRIVESNVDGSCPRVVALPPLRHKGWESLVGAPTWVPGEGREAGPLSC